MHKELSTYRRQGFGADIPMRGAAGLLIIDFVNGFADPDVFGGGNIRDAIASTAPLLAHARRQGWPVAHSRIVFADDDADHNVFSEKVPSLLSLKEASVASAIVDELTPVPGELVVRKTVPSAFFGTTLAAWMTAHGTRTLIVAGAVTSGCVRASVVDAMCHGFRVVVASDCVGDRALGPHEANLFDMQQKYASVTTRDEVIEALEGNAAPSLVRGRR